MRVACVSGIDDMAVENFSDSLGKAGFRMPDDEHRKSHGAQGYGRIFDRLALGCQTEVHRMQVDDVRAQPQFGQHERGVRARALFEEHVRTCRAVEQLSRCAFLEFVGAREDVVEFVGLEIVEIDQATSRPQRRSPHRRLPARRRAGLRYALGGWSGSSVRCSRPGSAARAVRDRRERTAAAPPGAPDR